MTSDRYAAFVGELAERQPQARFLLIGSRFYPEVEAVASRLNESLPGRVRSLRFSGLALGGCHGHPSLADHRLPAQLVADALRRD